MAKLSTQQIRNDLISKCLDGDDYYVSVIAKELDKEIVRIFSTQFGYTDEQIDKSLEHARRYPINIINQYFHLKGDKWLRAQHKVEFPKEVV